MTHHPNDPLLLAGKFICLFMQGLMIFGGIILALLIPALLFFQDEVSAEFAAEVQGAIVDFPLAALMGLFLIGLAIVAALFFFFGKLRRIISTVGEGDAFQPANAERLQHMGWLMLATQLLVIPAAALGIYFARFADEVEDANVEFNGDIDFTGILLVIILFILARVFRHGAAMRDDLEGTV